MSKILQSIRGMPDILPPEAEAWETIENLIACRLQQYGYKPIRMPIVEPTPLFKRAIGEVTDIVEKEMYSFTDSLNGEQLTLRPEGTAGCARAVIQHGLANQTTQRLYYMGPMFRHERPQKGRYRQFHQIGVEAFGMKGPIVDAEQILMIARLWDDIGLPGIRLQLNSLGEAEERVRHRADLITWLEKFQDILDEDAKRRLYTNPLRILDTKNPALQEMCAGAPRLLDYLGEASRAHFEGVQQILRDVGIPFEINPRLVRGLDYYNRTVFEWVTDRLGAQGTICAGGRYDSLVEQLGGKPTPACGFAMGVERLLGLIEANGGLPPDAPDIYLVHQGEAARRLAVQTAERLRDAYKTVLLHDGGGSFKSQMKKADASGAEFAVIIGDDEAATGDVQLKHLRDEAFGQQRIKAEAIDDIISNYLTEKFDLNTERKN
ncbi:MAG: histidine--tRNA ligase [Zoogloeaceae bacterium]|jgi:histidyl-tRNA synthetase|nr:histidine--tRNA ligase [Zoogloeaceae bacterium]